MIEKCPKGFLKWVGVLAGMVFAFFGYFAYMSATGGVISPAATTISELAPAGVATSVVQTGGIEEPRPSAFLGVEIISVDAVIAEQLEVPGGTGALVNSVVGGSPAEMAGLQRGDVIVTLDNSSVKDLDAFREIIAGLDPDDTVRIVFVRDGGKDVAYAQLAEAPAVAGSVETQGPDDSGWGVSLSPITPPLRETLGIPGDVNGVVILSVVPGGAADSAGLSPADVIRGVDNTPVADMSEFFEAISSDGDDTALLDVYTQGGFRYVPMDSSAVKVADETQTQQTLRQRILAVLTGGAPFTDDQDEDQRTAQGYGKQPQQTPTGGGDGADISPGGPARGGLLLTEHVNEEDDYEKPVCKRLEESGERYDQGDDVYSGEI